MAENLKTLIKRRGGIKSRLTLFGRYLDAFKINISNVGDSQLDQALFIELSTRVQEVENLFIDFKTIQTNIELIDEDVDIQLSERELFENSYYKLISSSKGLLTSYGYSQSGEYKPVRYVATPNCVNKYQSNSDLPKINLPKFNGYYENWLEYRDTFVSLIHNRDTLDEISKFHYLRSSLEGKAKQVIQSIEVSAANYNVAWELLCERYNNTRLLVHNHLNSLYKAPSIKRESATDLRNLLDSTSKHLRSLETLKLPVNEWDVIIIFLISLKLDEDTKREWQEFSIKNELPTLIEFKSFLKSKANVLETLEINLNESKSKQVSNTKQQRNAFVSTNTAACGFCSGTHYSNQCSDFLKLPVNSRIDLVKKHKLCLNCLKSRHTSKECWSGTCKRCNLKHHTLLHREKQNVAAGTEAPVGNQASMQIEVEKSKVVNEATSSYTMSSCNINQNTNVLLSTAIVQVVDSEGKLRACRALLDSGSQSNFISLELFSKLGLRKSKINLSVVGINQVESDIEYKCEIQIHSCHSKFKSSISCLILKTICDNIPNQNIDISNLNIPTNIELADPKCYVPGSIDLLIGAELFYNLLCIGQVDLGKSNPILQNTRLGWVISGPILSNRNQSKIYCNFSANIDVQTQLSKFWELEECSNLKPSLSKDELNCEEIFTKTTTRESDGKFLVTIPLKISLSKLGDSKQVALRRFYALESKLLKNPQLKQMYVDFMSEYENMKHMTRDTTSTTHPFEYYLPHHGVLKISSVSTKLRVVFDASCKSDSGYSLNDLQLVGPTIQDDLFSILIRFRQHKIVVCSDVAKMYRMVWVEPKQRSLQKIFWRSDPDHELGVYTLNTVTYGTASAPFLAIRCLKQLAFDFSESNPIASRIISQDFYVDDLLTGAETVSEAIKMAKEVSDILLEAGFELCKWASNSSEVISSILSSVNSSNTVQFDKGDIKTLGLYWSCNLDVLMYSIRPLSFSKSITKRCILSETSKIFDPLGLLSPCIIIAKILLQRLWCEKLSWDDKLPLDLNEKWQTFREQLSLLNDVKIPRHVICHQPIRTEIHGFCDASQQAYGGCIYIRSIDKAGMIHVSLLTSKSKVAPLKSQTIPRLELCGALVLAQLVNKVKSALNLNIDAIHLWCDSTIVLCWINTQPNTLQTFVSNRVSQIQCLTQSDCWHHVASQDNPADYLSRGIPPAKLGKCNMWWQGPSFLHQSELTWEKSVPVINENLHEVKKQITVVTVILIGELFPFTRFSKFKTMQRVMAYCLRFVYNCKHSKNRMTEPLTAKELNKANLILARMSQGESFFNEINDLNNQRQVKGRLQSLNPFVDNDGIIRVGGRLNLSKFNYQKRHPIVLLGKHPYTKLLVLFEHLRLLHASPQLLLSSIREQYWPIGGRNLTKQVVHRCVRCYRTQPTSQNPIMGVLPLERVHPQPPFHCTGVDYAGPFLIKDKRGRGNKLSKCYISLFICFSIKAIHLELVTDLTTESFIATFRRFVARRGKPAHVYSDNGLNFVGANTQLTKLGSFIINNEKTLVESFHNEGVTWHFIPANSPHFGGLWEAGVKSSKFHLKRVLSNTPLVYEDFATLLAQVEAVLNSRPLTPLSSDPNDLDVLTPAHFLIGKRLTSLPDPNVLEIQENRLSRFQRIQQLQQHFWNRWSREYIAELQQRVKWKSSQGELKLGSLVLVKDSNLPPLKWKLGRIIKLCPGSDGIARVASILTASGEIQRSFSKICPLPIDNNV